MQPPSLTATYKIDRKFDYFWITGRAEPNIPGGV
jgi:hypothetical protein